MIMIISNYLGVIVLFIILIQIKNMILSNFRFKLFRIRHKLFILASEPNSLKYDDDLYRELEQNINSLIRFAHRNSYFETLIFSLWFKIKYPNIRKVTRFSMVLSKFFKENRDKRLKNEIENILTDVETSIFKYFLSTSPIFVLVTLVKVFVFFIKKCCEKNQKILASLKMFIISDFKSSLNKIYFQNEKSSSNLGLC
ncbi:hypothetical protein [uncultured Fusobacterium sp.]|uniref:hypothetical protein n=1 Tax=uncultured Fusobacterium sp. TaxID=159267 RepID=UPI0025957BD7|nr:hypothetical protein [uncultured Fusobacterium sp.]